MNAYFEMENGFYFIPCLGIMAKCDNNIPDFSVLNNIIGYNHEKFMKVDFVDSQNAFPTKLSVFLSDSCNLKCSYCYYGSGGKSKEIELSIDDLDIIINSLIKNAKMRKLMGYDYQIDVLLTGGGEPTCNWKNFSYFVVNVKQRAFENGIPVNVSLVTNGVLNKKQIDFVCNHVDSIQVSYDGLSDIQNKNRRCVDGSASSDVVEQTMKELSIRNKNFFVRSTIMPCDYKRIYEMAREIFGQYSNAIRYHIEPIQYTGRANDFEKDTEKDNEIFIAEYIRTQKMVLKNFSDRKFYSSLFDYKITNISCSSITGESPVIDNRGKIFPCSDRLDFQTHGIGQILDGKIQIKNKSYYEAQYYGLLQTECGNCCYFSLCGGGCPSSFRRDSTGNLLPEGKVKCDLLKKYWNIAFSKLCNEYSFLELYLELDRKEDDWEIYKIQCKV